MDLTWLVAASLVAVSATYAAVRVRRPRLVDWLLLGGSLFALATRDLLRAREQGRPASEAESESELPAADADEPARPPLSARLLRRLVGWLD